MSPVSAGAALVATLFGWQAPAPPPEFTTLRIAERRITEENFQADRALRVGDESSSLLVEVGAALSARRIDVQLKNVDGRVRFRARLDALRGRLSPITEPLPSSPER
jgi:hypothetical protein